MCFSPMGTDLSGLTRHRAGLAGSEVSTTTQRLPLVVVLWLVLLGVLNYF